MSCYQPRTAADKTDIVTSLNYSVRKIKIGRLETKEAGETRTRRTRSLHNTALQVLRLVRGGVTFPRKRTKSPTVLIAATLRAFSTRMTKASRADVQKLVRSEEHTSELQSR